MVRSRITHPSGPSYSIPASQQPLLSSGLDRHAARLTLVVHRLLYVGASQTVAGREAGQRSRTVSFNTAMTSSQRWHCD